MSKKAVCMKIIDCEVLKEVVYNLCLQAGQELSPYPYEKILKKYEKTKSLKLAHILQNAENARKIQRPLCQDTGTVHVFMEVGNEISFSSNPVNAINEGVKKCYVEKFFRKSIVENEFLSGKNTETNTPALIDVEYVSGDKLTVKVLLKGAGCDNVSEVQMMLPSTTEDEFAEKVSQIIKDRAKNACPPCYISIGIGTGAESVMTVAEKGYFTDKNDMPELSEKILSNVNENAEDNFLVADLKITAKNHHMASLPVAIAFNCHSLRVASATFENDEIKYSKKVENFEKIETSKSTAKEVQTDDIESIRNLKEGENILLTGEILIARDAAHKKMFEYKKAKKPLPFNIENKIIFYAAPCSATPSEIVGPIGPTTAKRMDKFLPEFPQILATIGKGDRSDDAKNYIRNAHSIYFEAEGGIATLLSSCFKSYEMIAFEELSTEAVCFAKIEKLPLKVSVSAQK